MPQASVLLVKFDASNHQMSKQRITWDTFTVLSYDRLIQNQPSHKNTPEVGLGLAFLLWARAKARFLMLRFLISVPEKAFIQAARKHSSARMHDAALLCRSIFHFALFCSALLRTSTGNIFAFPPSDSPSLDVSQIRGP